MLCDDSPSCCCRINHACTSSWHSSWTNSQIPGQCVPIVFCSRHQVATEYPEPSTPARAQSPEKLQATLADMAAAVEKERASAVEAEKQLRTVHARSEQLTKARFRDTVNLLASCMC